MLELELEEEMRKREALRLARDPQTPAEVLAQLSLDEDWVVRAEVADHPNTPGYIIDTLACDQVGGVCIVALRAAIRRLVRERDQLRAQLAALTRQP